MPASPPPPPTAEARPWGPQDGLLRRAVATGARLLRPAGSSPPPASRPAAAPTPPPAADASPSPGSPGLMAQRRAWADRLWGEALPVPGGAAEVLRLATLLPLAPEHTLLLAGLGARVAGEVVAGARGCFVSAHDILPLPAAAGRHGTTRRVTAARFAPAEAGFRTGYHQHALLLEPFRAGGTPAGLIRATAAALRRGGQLVLLELVAPADQRVAAEARWLTSEMRAAPPAEAAVTAALAAAGFEVHVLEDAAPRHRRAVLDGWSALLAALRAEPRPPAPPEAAALVAEAEAWLLRLRLLRDGRLRLLRWHASLARPPG